MLVRCLAVALFGLWFMFAPWVIGFSDHTVAVSVSVICGAIQVIASLWAMVIRDGDSIPNLVTFVTGIVFAVLPFTFLTVHEGIGIAIVGMLTLVLSFYNLRSK